MRRPRRKLEVNTFPFLAVLLCAMGSFILLLMVIDRRAKIVAQNKARDEYISRKMAMDASRDAAVKDQDAKQKAVFQMQKDAIHVELKKEEEALGRQMTELLAALAKADEQIVGQKSASLTVAQKIAIDDAALKTLQQELAARHDQLEKTRQTTQGHLKIREQLTRDIAVLEAALRHAQQRSISQRPVYSLVPYKGKHGASAKPIYIEVADGETIVHPGGARLGALNWSPEAFRRAIEERTGPLEKETFRPGMPPPDRTNSPYILFLVRPSGISLYYDSQQALRGYRVDYGYELVEPDWVFDFSDGKLDQQPWRNVARLDIEPSKVTRPPPKGMGPRTLAQSPGGEFLPPPNGEGGASDTGGTGSGGGLASANLPPPPSAPGGVPGGTPANGPGQNGFPGNGPANGGGFGVPGGTPSGNRAPAFGAINLGGPVRDGPPGGAAIANGFPSGSPGLGTPNGAPNLGGAVGLGGPGPAVPGQPFGDGAGRASIGNPISTPGLPVATGSNPGQGNSPYSANPYRGSIREPAQGGNGSGSRDGQSARFGGTTPGTGGGSPGSGTGGGISSGNSDGRPFDGARIAATNDGSGSSAVQPAPFGANNQGGGPPGANRGGIPGAGTGSGPLNWNNDGRPFAGGSTAANNGPGSPAGQPAPFRTNNPATGGGGLPGANFGDSPSGGTGGGYPSANSDGGPSDGSNPTGAGGGRGFAGDPKSQSPSVSNSPFAAAQGKSGSAAGGQGGVPSLNIDLGDAKKSSATASRDSAVASDNPLSFRNVPPADQSTPPNDASAANPPQPGEGGGPPPPLAFPRDPGDPNAEPGPRVGNSPFLPQEKARPGPRLPSLGRLVSNRDFVLTVECFENKIYLAPPGRTFDLTEPQSIDQLATQIQTLVTRRQATVRPGEPPYRPIVHFRVQPDGRRTYYAVYPRIADLGYPMNRETPD